MIRYKDVFERLREAGYSTYTIMREKHLSQRTLTSIRQNKPISTTSIDVICRLTKCQPGDIMEYVESPVED